MKTRRKAVKILMSSLYGFSVAFDSLGNVNKKQVEKYITDLGATMGKRHLSKSAGEMTRMKCTLVTNKIKQECMICNQSRQKVVEVSQLHNWDQTLFYCISCVKQLHEAAFPSVLERMAAGSAVKRKTK